MKVLGKEEWTFEVLILKRTSVAKHALESCEEEATQRKNLSTYVAIRRHYAPLDC